MLIFSMKLLQDWYGVCSLFHGGLVSWIWSKSNDASDAVDNVGLKNELIFFTYESCDTVKSFSLFLIVKTISKLNMEHSVELEIGIWKN